MKLKQADRILKYFLLLCIILYGFTGIIGCGGGGDGSAPLQITYTGLTTRAEITDANAELFAAGAFGAERAGSAFSRTGAVEKSNSGSINSFRTFRISHLLENAVLQVDLSSITSPPFIGASESGTENGSCGGTVSYTIQYNEETGVFSGTFTFKSYCDSGVIINGSTTVDGTINPVTSTFDDIHFRFENLSDGSSTLRGDLDMDFTVDPIRAELDTYIKDNASGTVYWASKYVMNLTEISGYVYGADVEIISGEYYEPNYGYVTVATPTPFSILETVDTDIWPHSGVMIVTGTGNTKARLTAIGDIFGNYCQIDADLNGDDTYEWGPVTKQWQDL
jgi:hypothetical protein